MTPEDKFPSSRLEKRLGRAEYDANEMMKDANSLGMGTAGKTAFGILGILGLFLALIPALLWGGISIFCLWFVWTLLSYF